MKNIFALFGMLFSLAAFSQIPSYVPTNGLAGYWSFTGNANDASVNLNNGSVTGATLTTDRFGNPASAYQFNGATDFVTVPNSNSLSGFNDISISMWVNMAQYSGIQALAYKWDFVLNCGSNTDNYAASIWNNTIILTTNYSNISGYTSPTTFNTADLNTWKHFVFVSNSTQGISIYINGVFSGTGSFPGTLCSSTNPLYFGVATGNTRFFKGKLDDIGIWGRVLTPCEISQLYASSTLPLTSVVTSNSLICKGDSVTLTANGNATSYLWNTNATTSSIVVSPTITTTYTVSANNIVTGCSNTLTIIQNVDDCTGIEIQSQQSAIIVYPNPSNGNINIGGDLFFSKYEITNMLGQIIAIGDIDNNTIKEKSLLKGIYNINLFSDKMKVTKKISIE